MFIWGNSKNSKMEMGFIVIDGYLSAKPHPMKEVHRLRIPQPRELHWTPVNFIQPPWTTFNPRELHSTPVNSIQPPWTPCNPSELHSTPVNSIQPPWTPFNSPSAQPYIGLSKMACRPKDTIFRAECMVLNAGTDVSSSGQTEQT